MGCIVSYKPINLTVYSKVISRYFINVNIKTDKNVKVKS